MQEAVYMERSFWEQLEAPPGRIDLNDAADENQAHQQAN